MYESLDSKMAKKLVKPRLTPQHQLNIIILGVLKIKMAF
jgi:hypothetical protein